MPHLSFLTPDPEVIADNSVDVSQPHVCQVQLSADRKTLWINVDGVCLLRVCRPQNGFVFDGLTQTESH